MTFADKELLTRYLLGDVSVEDRERLENAYLADDELWESLTAIENDLIDAYVRGDLPEPQKRQFEEHFLSSAEKFERLEMARLLMDSGVREAIRTTPAAPEKPGLGMDWPVASAWRRNLAMNLALVAATLAVAMTVAFLVLQNRHLRTDLAQLQSQQAGLQQQISQLQQQIAAFSTGGPKENGTKEPETVALLLTPGLSRNVGQANNSGILKIPPAAGSVVLMLQLQRDHYQQYQATVETPEGKRVASIQALKSQPGKNGSRIVSVNLPSQHLKKGDYVVTLSGKTPNGESQEINSYVLSVTR